MQRQLATIMKAAPLQSVFRLLQQILSFYYPLFPFFYITYSDHILCHRDERISSSSLLMLSSLHKCVVLLLSAPKFVVKHTYKVFGKVGYLPG